MKKLCVEKDMCIGCGACVAIDSNHFDFDENGLSEVINNENIDTPEVQNAISSCPVGAIKTVENTCNCGEKCTCGENCNCDNSCACHKGN